MVAAVKYVLTSNSTVCCLTCYLIKFHSIRVLEYADIFLFDVTMILPHGQGLCTPLRSFFLT